MKTAVVLMGHGSRDAAGAAEFAALAEALRQLRPEWSIAAGVLEFPSAEVPSIQEAFDQAVAHGARRIIAAPVLLFRAGHAKDDMPREIEAARFRHPAVEIAGTADLGTAEALLDLVADRVAEVGAREPAGLGESVDATGTAVLLVGRGSTHPEANAELFRMARLLWERGGAAFVEAAFVSLTTPSVPDGIERCVRLGAGRVVVIPYFLNTGILVKRIADQAAEAQAKYPDRVLMTGQHFGLDDRLVGLIADRIEAVAESAGWDPASGALEIAPARDGGTGGEGPEPAVTPQVSEPEPAGTLLARYALPADRIEAVSLDRIEALLGSGCHSPLDRWSGAERLLAKRLVYASGDPAIVRDIRIHPAAVPAGIEALRRGAPIVTDVRMVEAGISRRLADRLGCAICCAIEGAAVAGQSRITGWSRSAVGIEALAERLDGAVVAIGNAPTALLHLLDLIAAGRAHPALIVGVPVGFVAAAEAKAELARCSTPYVTILGSRGGSGIAVAAVNTLLRLATGGEGL